jgi:hypothetical protein
MCFRKRFLWTGKGAGNRSYRFPAPFPVSVEASQSKILLEIREPTQLGLHYVSKGHGLSYCLYMVCLSR